MDCKGLAFPTLVGWNREMLGSRSGDGHKPNTFTKKWCYQKVAKKLSGGLVWLWTKKDGTH